MQDRIFLSHKGANKEIVRPYYQALKEAGFRPWLDDEDMPAGMNPDRGMLQGFKDSCAVVFFITSEFKDEKYLRDEINYAKQEERAKGDRFAIISLILPGPDKSHMRTLPDLKDQFLPGPEMSHKPTVPDLLRQYIWIEEDDPLISLTKIIEALPIRLGGPRWKTEPDRDELDAWLKSVRGKIDEPPDGQTVPPRECPVSGTVDGYNQQPLYLFTGDRDRFWPSARIVPDPEGRWTGGVHLGDTMPTGTIRLAAVDSNLAEYIEVYRSQAGHMNHGGMVIPKFPWVLHMITVKVDLPKK